MAQNLFDLLSNMKKNLLELEIFLSSMDETSQERFYWEQRYLNIREEYENIMKLYEYKKSLEDENELANMLDKLKM